MAPPPGSGGRVRPAANGAAANRSALPPGGPLGALRPAAPGPARVPTRVSHKQKITLLLFLQFQKRGGGIYAALRCFWTRKRKNSKRGHRLTHSQASSAIACSLTGPQSEGKGLKQEVKVLMKGNALPHHC